MSEHIKYRKEVEMKRLVIVCLSSALLLVVTSASFAQERPCAADIAQFCGNVQPGEGRIAKCLKQNEAQLSPGCKMHLVQVKEALKEAHQACEDDIAMFCGGVKPGEGRVVECLKANKAHLSRKCKIKLFEAKKEMK